MEVLPLADAGARDDPGASRPKSLQQRADESCNFKDPGGAMVISILARNLEHRAKPFFEFLQRQDYPKKKICILVQTSNNQDATVAAIANWTAQNEADYAGVVIRRVDPSTALAPADTTGWEDSQSCTFRPHCWEPARLVHVAKLREAALVYAQQKSARYFLSLDTDVMLTEYTAITKLVKARRPVVAPLLYAYPNNWDANVWEETHPGGGYRRGRFQLPFRSQRLRGCIKVQGVHSTLLVDLKDKKTRQLHFLSSPGGDSEHGASSDTNAFSQSAAEAGIDIYGCNDMSYGYMLSIAGEKSEKNTFREEMAVFQRLVDTELVLSSDQLYQTAVPVIPDAIAFECPECPECDYSEASQITDQLDELRQSMLTQLDRAADSGAQVACSWDGDCSDLHFQVDRRSNLSLAEFHTEYSMKRRPVVITDYINEGRLSTKGEVFDEEYWKRKCGGHVYRVQRAAGSAGWGGLSKHSDQTLNRSFDVIRESDDPDLYGIFDAPLITSCKSVLDEFVMPKYFANDFMQRVDHKTTLTYRDSWPSFFLGKGDTVANLHVDMFGSSFWMAVFKGKKHWRFVDESQRGLLYEHRPTSDFPGVNLFEPDYDKYPLLRHVRTFDVVLNPGDLLFVPGGSPHQVKNIGETISLAGNYVDLGSFETMREEVDHPRRKTFARYRELEHTLLDSRFPKEMDLAAGDMSWKNFKAQATWSPHDAP